MNKAYRIVWNEAQAALVVVEETAKARGKSGRSRTVQLAPAAAMGAGMLAISLAAMPSAYAQYTFTGGTSVSATGAGSVALGYKSSATSAGDVAIGAGNLALGSGRGDTSYNLGPGVGGAVAIGANNVAVEWASIALGLSNSAKGSEALAAGYDNSAFGTDSVAIGNHNSALGSGSLAQGWTNVASGNGSSALGMYNTAIGTAASASVALGTHNTVKGLSVGIGNNDTITADNTFVLGSNVTTSQGNSVVLGNSSTTHAADPSSSITINNKQYAFAGTATSSSGVVSVGKPGAERQIINVAAGLISASSTDAVNGSQLYAVASAIGNSQTIVGGGTHYYSVNDGGTQGSNYNNDGAQAANSLAAGVMAHSGGINGIAIGYRASVSDVGGQGGGAIAIGSNSFAGPAASVDYGAAVAVGASSTAGGASVAVGPSAYAKNSAVAIGMNSVATGAKSTALGLQATASNPFDVALGSMSVTGAPDAVNTVINGKTYQFAGTNPSGVVSVGNPTAWPNANGALTRQITNVAAGLISSTSTDAVNGSQLYAFAFNGGTGAATHYYSVNDGGTQGGNYNNNGATGTNSLAAGVGDIASGTQSTAVGYNNTAAYAGAVAMGSGNTAAAGATSGGQAYGAVAIGWNNSAMANGAVAAGQANTATGADSVALGNYNIATSSGGLAQGVHNLASGGNGSLALGYYNSATGPGTVIALGANNVVPGGSSVAIGSFNSVANNNTFVIGNKVTSTQANSVILGSASADHAADVSAPALSATFNNGSSFTFAGRPSVANGVVSVGAQGKERQIINVAAGLISSDSTDAVNGSQLYATNTTLNNVINDVHNLTGSGTHFYSVASNDTTAGNYNNRGATGTNALAAGVGDVSSGTESTTVGYNNTATGSSSVAIGSGNTATGELGAVAQGFQNTASGRGSVAIGQQNTAAGVDSLAQGNYNAALGTGSLGLGMSNVAQGDGSLALGDSNTATGLGSSLALGRSNTTTGNYSTSIGNSNTVTGNSSFVTGNSNVVTGNNTFVLGNQVTAAQSNSVVLGNLSTSRAPDTGAGATSVTFNSGATFTFAGAPSATNGVVSVGAQGKERQIINVAAGQVSANSTDAINGSQLYATNTAVDRLIPGVEGAVQYDRNTNGSINYNSVTLNPGGTGSTKITNVADGAVTANSTDAVNGSQLYSINEAATAGWNVTTSHLGTGTATGTSVSNIAPGATQTVTAGNNIAIAQNGVNLTIATNPNLVVDSVTAGNTVLNNTGVTITQTGGNTVSITANGLNNGGNRIINVAAGTDLNDAVNLGQLQSVAANSTHYYSVNSTVTGPNSNYDNNGARAANSLAAGVNSVSLGNQSTTVGYGNTASGSNAVAIGANNTASGELGAVAQGYLNVASGQGSVAIGQQNTASGVDSLAQGNFNTATGQGSLALGMYNTTQGDGSLALGDRNVATGLGSSLALGLSNTATGEKSAAIGNSSTATGNNAFTIGNGNVVKNNNTFVLGNGVTSTQNNSVILGNASADRPAVGVPSGMIGTMPYAFAGTSPVGVVSVGAPDAERQIINVAAGQIGASSTDAINGSQLYATNTAITNIQTDVAGAVKYDSNGNGGFNYNHVTLQGTGGTTITNLAPGAVTSTSMDAVNGSQLYAVNEAANAGWNVTTAATGTGKVSGTSVANVKPNDTVTLTAGNNISIAQNGENLTVATNPDLIVDSVTAGNTVLNNAGVTITSSTGGNTVSLTTNGLDNGGNKIINVAAGDLSPSSTDAVNGSQLYTTNQNVAGAVKYDSNGNGGFNYNSVTLQGTPSTDGGRTGGTTITNVAQGALNATSTDAVNGSQLYAVNEAANAGWNVTTAKTGTGTVSGTSVANVKPNDTVTLTAGNNISIAQNGENLTVATNPDLIVDSVTAGNTVLNNAGVTITSSTGGNTVSLTTNGLDNGGNKIINVAAGELSPSSTDAVNGSQLYTTNQNVAGAVKYDSNGNGGFNFNSVTLQGTGGTTITNLAPGAVTSTSMDAVNGSQLYAVNEAANAGWNVTTAKTGTGTAPNAGEDPVNIGPNDTLTLTAGNNISIAQNGENLTIATNPDLYADNVFINNSTVSLTPNGLNNGGNRIINVAAGIDLNDAVNLGQMQTAIASSATHYYSVNDGGTHGGNYDNNGATGLNSLAAGVNALASGAGSVVMGTGANDGGNLNATVLGQNAGIASNLVGHQNALGINESYVALGYGSTVTAPSVAVASGVIGGTTYTYAGSTPVGVVSVGGPKAERQITNVAAGQILSTSTDAVNGSQLYATNTAVDNIVAGKTGAFVSENAAGDPTPVATGTKASAGGFGAVASGDYSLAVGNLASAAGANSTVLGQGANDGGNGNATVVGQGASIAAGLTGSNVALGQGSVVSANAVPVANGTIGGAVYNYAGSSPIGVVSVGSDGAARQITNVAAGQITANSTDAVNGSQLYATNQAIEASATHFYSVNVAGGADPTDGNYANNGATGENSLAAGVNVAASGNEATAVGVNSTAAGNRSVALGYNSTVTGEGSGAIGDPTEVSGANSWSMGNNNSLSGNNSYALGNTNTIANNDSFVLGNNITTSQDNSVILGSSSTDRAAVAVATGTITGDVYNYAGTNPVGVVSVGSGSAPRQIINVAAGQVSADSTDAINGSQLYATQQALQDDMTKLAQSVANDFGGGTDTRDAPSVTVTNPTYVINGNTYTNVGDALSAAAASGGGGTSAYFGVNDGGVIGGNYAGEGASGADSLAAGRNALASGDSATAVGNNATASGAKSTALGNGAVATGANSVALGAGSVANEDNTVSVGSQGAERRITNVANGVNGTDAANMNQLWQMGNGINANIDNVAKHAYAGVASAMAMPNLTPMQPGHTVVAVGGGYFHGQSASGIGVTYRSDNGRWLLNGAASYDTMGDAGVRVQVGYEF